MVNTEQYIDTIGPFLLALDATKQLFYVLKFMEDFPDSERFDSLNMSTKTIQLGGQGLRPLMEAKLKSMSIAAEECETNILDYSQELAAAMRSILDFALADRNGKPVQMGTVLSAVVNQAGVDIPFYDDGRYGRYWNEVPMPEELDAVFDAYFGMVAKSNLFKGLLGPSAKTNIFSLKQGSCALSFYDLSGDTLMFQTMEDAKEFLSLIGYTEPVDTMYLDGNRWVG